LTGDGAAARANVAVIIVNYRTPELTEACLAALTGERALLPKLRVIVVDGGSGDGSAEELGRTVAGETYRDWVEFLPLPINGGFGWANNQALLRLARESSPPDYVHLLNPDAKVTRGAIARLVEELKAHPRCAAAGSQLLASDGSPAGAGYRFPTAGRELVSAARTAALGRVLGIRPTVVVDGSEVDWVTGASVMLRTAALRETGLFDDGFFLYFEEVELMHRLRAAGWLVRHVPESRVYHAEGSSTGIASVGQMPEYWYRSRQRYFQLTGGRALAVAADMAWMLGRPLGVLKTALRPQGSRHRIRTLDLMRHSLGCEPASAPSWGDAPGKPPAWMAARD
jgi:GT2 family glycosyltransferase